MMHKLGNRGLTMVELMVATVVTGILIVVIMGFFVNSIANYATTSARSDLLREAQLSLDSITQEIRLSGNAYAAPTLLDENAPGGGWTGDGSVLILGTAALDSEHNVIFADPLNYTSVKNNNIYYIQDGKLHRRTLAADIEENAKRTTCPAEASTADCPSDTVLADNVGGFTVRYFDSNDVEVQPNAARSIELTLNLATTKYGRNVEASFTTRTVFRNE